MATTTTDPDTIENELRALVDARMGAGRTLALAAAERDARRAALEASETDYATAHAAALTAGWTAAELKKVGLEEPTAKATVPRARRRRTPAPNGTTGVAAAADGGSGHG